mmetsp:Transcript_9433/g.13149  ORF Transcript_9433/g.13149 Transcript_9433/m.13149 type:complete len:220 (+) Transcript_9433:69-728(+)
MPMLVLALTDMPWGLKLPVCLWIPAGRGALLLPAVMQDSQQESHLRWPLGDCAVLMLSSSLQVACRLFCCGAACGMLGLPALLLRSCCLESIHCSKSSRCSSDKRCWIAWRRRSRGKSSSSFCMRQKLMPAIRAALLAGRMLCADARRPGGCLFELSFEEMALPLSRHEFWGALLSTGVKVISCLLWGIRVSCRRHRHDQQQGQQWQAQQCPQGEHLAM